MFAMYMRRDFGRVADAPIRLQRNAVCGGPAGETRFDNPENRWHVTHGSNSGICLEPGAVIKTLLAAVVLAAFLAPTSLSTRVSIAAAVHDLDVPAEQRVGKSIDGRTRATWEFDRGRDSAGPAQLNTFDNERSNDFAGGMSFPIHGVAFTFDEAIAGSYRTDLAHKSMTDADDLPVIGDSRDFSFAARNASRASQNFTEHMKSVSESRFTSPQLVQVNEWDARDFKPPEWIATLREAARSEVRDEPAAVASARPGAAYDTTSLLKDGVKILMSVQAYFEEINPWLLAVLGLIGFPFAMVRLARTLRHRRPHSRTRRTRRRIRLTARVRRRRQRTRSLGLNTEVRS